MQQILHLDVFSYTAICTFLNGYKITLQKCNYFYAKIKENFIPFTKTIDFLGLLASFPAVFAVPLWILGHSVIMCKHLHNASNPQVLHRVWVIITAFVQSVPPKGSESLDNE